MSFVNVYSGLVFYLFSLAVAALIIFRRGNQPREWIILASLALIGGLVWLFDRPIQTSEGGDLLAGLQARSQPVLLEFQSPY